MRRCALALLLLLATIGPVPAGAAPDTCGGLAVTIPGTSGPDHLVGTSGPDVIDGGSGDDVIDGRGGDDVICGGPGRDRLLGAAGGDTLLGMEGGDLLRGGTGPDLLVGGAGNDRLDGGTGTDRARGGTGTDRCEAERPRDCEALTYFVRTDGGSPAQCTGTADRAYPGTGTDRPCAWDHPFRALPPAGPARLSAGDTLTIGPGEYRMGTGAPGSGGCDPAASFDCRLGRIPGGTAAHPTRILGAGGPGCSAPPQLWGSGGSDTILDLTGASHVELGCLEITDHSSCVEFHSGRIACNREAPGAWASVGITATDSADVVLHDLDVHGLAAAGIAAGRLHDWSVTRVSIVGNGWVGWEGDVPGADANTGTMAFRRVDISWNGCGETYPGRKPTGCWGQTAGGYGDGLGTGETGGRWVFLNSTFSHNTSDGLDLLYLRRPGSRVILRGVTAEGNAGDQIKTTGPAYFTGLEIDAACGFFAGRPFTHHVDPCRAGGSALALGLRPGNTVSVREATIAGDGDCLMIAECAGNGGCQGTERVRVVQAEFTGGRQFGGGGDTTCLAWHDLPTDPFRYRAVTAHRVKASPCPPGVVCD